MTVVQTIMAAVAVVSFGAITQAQVSPATVEIPADVKEHVRKRVERGSSMGIVVGLVNASGTTFYSAGSKTKGGDPVSESTIFEIGSVTKVFTSLLLADAVERGTVKLNDPIDGFVCDGVKAPSFDGTKITLHDLATHRSGLPRMPWNISPADVSNPYADYTDKKLHEFLTDHKLRRKPGSVYEYSNLGAGLLGHLLARKAGKTYVQLIRERICKPLGLKDTTLTRSSAPTDRLAHGHSGSKPASAWDFDCLAGCGAIRSTAKDMLTFLAAHMGFEPSPLRAAMERMRSERRDTDNANLKIGLGWHISTMGDATAYWHNGETGGFHSFVGFHAERGVGVVVLANSNTSIDDIGLHLLDRRSNLRMPIIEITLFPEELERYVGKYKIAGQKIFYVAAAGNRLRMRFGNQKEFHIIPESKTVFRLEEGDATVTFTMDDTGRVKKLVLSRNGVDVPATRMN